MKKDKDDNSREEKEPIKIILLGDSGVGKTNIISRYLKDEFNKNTASTIGTTFGIKELVRNNIKYNLNIWDTTGQEIYRSVTKLFIQNSKIAILVYSVNNKDSFESLDYWYKSIFEICDKNVVLAIAANKTDLFVQEEEDEKGFVPEDDGQKYAEEKKAIFKSVSAKIDKKGIDLLFDQCLDAYIQKNVKPESKEKEENKYNGNIAIDNKKNSKKSNKRNFC